VNPSASRAGTRTFDHLFAAGVLPALWLASHPYLGAIHDARLYLFEALARFDAPRFSGDLYLRYGSQDNFSVYGRLLSSAVGWLGAPAANFWVTVLAEGLWLLGAVLLVRAAVSSFAERVMALGAIILLPSAYGGFQIFHYAEVFQSPRPFVETMAMIAIAWALRGRWLRSVALLLLSATVHPLMALPGAALVFVLAAPREARLVDVA
jgi:hypothetical protein